MAFPKSWLILSDPFRFNGESISLYGWLDFWAKCSHHIITAWSKQWFFLFACSWPHRLARFFPGKTPGLPGSKAAPVCRSSMAIKAYTASRNSRWREQRGYLVNKWSWLTPKATGSGVFQVGFSWVILKLKRHDWHSGERKTSYSTKYISTSPLFLASIIPR